MSTTQVFTDDRRVQPRLIAGIVAVALIVVLGIGLAAAWGVGSTKALVPSATTQVSDMSTAAYAAIHPAVPCAAAPGTDMSAAAYGATHAATNLCVAAPATDMSTAAYNATHQATTVPNAP
jgi:hypothetical protein